MWVHTTHWKCYIFYGPLNLLVPELQHSKSRVVLWIFYLMCSTLNLMECIKRVALHMNVVSYENEKLGWHCLWEWDPVTWLFEVALHLYPLIFVHSTSNCSVTIQIAQRQTLSAFGSFQSSSQKRNSLAANNITVHSNSVYLNRLYQQKWRTVQSKLNKPITFDTQIL